MGTRSGTAGDPPMQGTEIDPPTSLNYFSNGYICANYFGTTDSFQIYFTSIHLIFGITDSYVDTYFYFQTHNRPRWGVTLHTVPSIRYALAHIIYYY